MKELDFVLPLAVVVLLGLAYRVAEAYVDAQSSKAKLYDAERFEIMWKHPVRDEQREALKKQGWKIFG